jgi:2-oxoglutarate/2-oxoacid ferredoxin oxidoreductase subunit alpha
MALAPDKFQEIESVVVRFAGDSGDGMQTVGERFTDASVIAGNDIRTLPDFPAEIRAPAGSLPGVSGFQIQFGSTEILTPGDAPGALVAMNPAALRTNLDDLVDGGLLVVDTEAFNPDNLSLAGYDANPLEDPELARKHEVIRLNLTELTKEALKDSPLTMRDKLRCKNFFALGFMYWVYDRRIDTTIGFIEAKWGKKKPELAAANIAVLKAGYFFGETSEIRRNRYQVNRAAAQPGRYRKISGNDAIVLGLLAAAEKSGRELVYAGYPITPASSILEGLAWQKNFGVKAVQAEDEIAAIGIAIGASFAGALAATGTSGPGMCLKSEFIGLAISTELPLLIFNIQRGGPSTGLPTKVEQSDLLQSLFGRHGESPLPVLAASGPGDCFATTMEAARIALAHSTPVIVLSDLTIANGSEPWRVPNLDAFPAITAPRPSPDKPFHIFEREPGTLARRQAFPGEAGFEHRIGGLEKDEKGGVSYDAANHEEMTRLRAAKVEAVADFLPPLDVNGPETGDLLVLGWGGTCGALTAAARNCRLAGHAVSSLNLRHLNPFPKELAGLLGGFTNILIPELNSGHLRLLIRARFGMDAIGLNKIQGKPFRVAEVENEIRRILNAPTP